MTAGNHGTGPRLRQVDLGNKAGPAAAAQGIHPHRIALPAAAQQQFFSDRALAVELEEKAVDPTALLLVLYRIAGKVTVPRIVQMNVAVAIAVLYRSLCACG